MKIEEIVDKLLNITTKIDAETVFDLIGQLMTTESSLQELQKCFDRTLRARIASRDDIKALLLANLFGRIKGMSQVPEYTNPKTGMKTKARDIPSFIADIKNTQYEEIAIVLEGIT